MSKFPSHFKNFCLSSYFPVRSVVLSLVPCRSVALV